MKFVKIVAAGFALGLAATACVATTPSAPAPVTQVAPNPRNVLDAYIARPDPSFAWKVEKTFTGAGYHGAVLELTSQTWLSDKEIDRSVWKHWLTVTIPDQVTSNKAFLFIGGGSNGRAAPAGPSEQLGPDGGRHRLRRRRSWARCPTSRCTSPTARRVNRTEDDIIAYLQARYDPRRIPRRSSACRW